MHQRTIPLLFLAFILFPGFSLAADYKRWMPHIPNTLGNLKAESPGDGMNLDMGGINGSTLSRLYGNDSDGIELVITYSDSGQMMHAQPMGNMSFETSEGLHRTISIQGFDGFYTYDKISKEASLMLFLGDKGTLGMSTFGKAGELDLTEIADEIALKKIHASFGN